MKNKTKIENVGYISLTGKVSCKCIRDIKFKFRLHFIPYFDLIIKNNYRREISACTKAKIYILSW